MAKKNFLYITIIIIFIITLLLVGCSKEEPILSKPISTDQAINSCEGCHTNYDVLKTIATQDTLVGGGGCSGDVPQIEPYDRVYLDPTKGYNEFKQSVHGKLACTACHNGVNNTSDKKEAHSSSSGFLKHPSNSAEKKCASCHPDIVTRTKNSLHEQGLGQKNMVIKRGGFGSWANVPHEIKDGYDQNCGKCHASCGDCHVNRPLQGGGGLYAGHRFTKTPDMRDACITCHVSRGGHAYLGIGAGTVPDVHYTKRGYTCLACHDKNEIHGDGNTYEHRYQMKLKPECSDCHKNQNSTNPYHALHFNTFNCQTCHSQDYNNCGSCHIGGDGTRIAPHMKFKIAINPIPDTKPYKFSTVRQSLMAPDSWSVYGLENLANFAVAPTYKYTTPHNILRWTSRTKVDPLKPCYDNCHIIKEGTNYRNRNLYLFNSDLNSWEIEANKNIVVDGKLPNSWN